MCAAGKAGNVKIYSELVFYSEQPAAPRSSVHGTVARARCHHSMYREKNGFALGRRAICPQRIVLQHRAREQKNHKQTLMRSPESTFLWCKGDRSAKCMRVTARSRVSNMGTFWAAPIYRGPPSSGADGEAAVAAHISDMSRNHRYGRHPYCVCTKEMSVTAMRIAGTVSRLDVCRMPSAECNSACICRGLRAVKPARLPCRLRTRSKTKRAQKSEPYRCRRLGGS